MSKKLVLQVAFASMVLGSSAPISALSAKEAVLAPVFVGLGLSAYCLSYQHSVVDFKQKGEWKRLLKLNQLLSDRKGYVQNAKDVFWTKWIGQQFKDKELKANATTGKIKQSRLKPPTGVMGWTSTYVYTGKKAAGLLTTFGAAYLFLTHPDLIGKSGAYLQKKYGFAKEEEQKEINPADEANIRIAVGEDPRAVLRHFNLEPLASV